MRLNIISIKNIICLILIIISFFLDRISKLKVVNDQIGTPTSARWVAKITQELIIKKLLMNQ